MANFASLEEWTRAVIRAQRGGTIDAALQRATEDGRVRAVLTGGEIGLGGALIPEEMAATLFIPPTTHRSIWSMCTSWTMSSAILEVPAVYDKTHASGAAPYGVKFRWNRPGVDSSTSTRQSPIRTQQIRLDASGTVEAYTVVNTPLVEDAAGEFADIFTMLFSKGLSWEMERVIVRGSGAGEPVGILNANARVGVTRATASEVDRADIAAMQARLLPGCFGRAVWLFNPAILTTLEGVNDESIVRAVPRPEVSNMTIDGRPAIASEHCSALGTSGDILLADLAAYFIGNRQQLTVQMSPHPDFPRNRTHVRAIARFDGQPGIVTPITPAQGTDTLSAFVSL